MCMLGLAAKQFIGQVAIADLPRTMNFLIVVRQDLAVGCLDIFRMRSAERVGNR